MVTAAGKKATKWASGNADQWRQVKGAKPGEVILVRPGNYLLKMADGRFNVLND